MASSTHPPRGSPYRQPSFVLPQTLVHSSHSARLHAHLTDPPPRSQLSQVPNNQHISSRRISPRHTHDSQTSRIPPSLRMTPHKVPLKSSGASYTEIIQALATVPPPSPSPRSRQGSTRVAASLPTQRSPALRLSSSRACPVVVEHVPLSTQSWLPSSLPKPLRREVPIDGILQLRQPERRARRISVKAIVDFENMRVGGKDGDGSGVESEIQGSHTACCSLRDSA